MSLVWLKRWKAQSCQCWLKSLWSTLYTHIYRETSAVAVSSLQSVSDVAIHWRLMQIGRAVMQKKTLLNNNLPQRSNAKTPSQTLNTHTHKLPCKHRHASKIQAYMHLQTQCTLNTPNKLFKSQRLSLMLPRHSPTNTAAPLCGVIRMHTTNVQPTSHQAHGHCCRFIKDGGWSDSCI